MKTQAGCAVPETDKRLKNTQHCEMVLQNFARWNTRWTKTNKHKTTMTTTQKNEQRVW